MPAEIRWLSKSGFVLTAAKVGEAQAIPIDYQTAIGGLGVGMLAYGGRFELYSEWG